MCIGCGQCTTKCKFEAIKLVKKYDIEGISFEKLKPAVIKNILKRKVRIQVTKVKKALGFKRKSVN